jgi:RNA polymerase sigma-70 factor (ECF subfamily)
MENLEIRLVSINELALKYIETRSERDFRNLFERIRPGLTNYANNILKDLDAANDVVADAFVKMWSRIDTYKPCWCFSTWAYRVTRNEAMQYIRKKKQLSTVSLENCVKFIGSSFEDSPDFMLIDNGIDHEGLISMPDEIDPMLSPEDVTDALYQSVMEQMNKLPAHYKDIIIDREVHEMQYEEIAAKYGLELNTVKTRIIRAREKIMQMANLGDRKSKRKSKKKAWNAGI